MTANLTKNWQTGLDFPSLQQDNAKVRRILTMILGQILGCRVNSTTMEVILK